MQIDVYEDAAAAATAAARCVVEAAGEAIGARGRFILGLSGGSTPGPMFEALAQEADLDWVAVDSTSIRAQAQAAGGRLKRGALRPRALAGPAAGSAPRSTR